MAPTVPNPQPDFGTDVGSILKETQGQPERFLGLFEKARFAHNDGDFQKGGNVPSVPSFPILNFVNVHVDRVQRMTCINSMLRGLQQSFLEVRNSQRIRRIVIDREFLAAFGASQHLGMMTV
jgi:hypothetical protein